MDGIPHGMYVLTVAKPSTEAMKMIEIYPAVWDMRILLVS